MLNALWVTQSRCYIRLLMGTERNLIFKPHGAVIRSDLVHSKFVLWISRQSVRQDIQQMGTAPTRDTECSAA